MLQKSSARSRRRSWTERVLIGLVALVALVTVNAVLVSAKGLPARGSDLMRVGARQIHVQEDGSSSSPTLVLLHGTAGSTAWWDDIVPALAKTHHVVRIDMLGHGDSQKPTDGDYAVHAQARLVGEVLDQLGVERAVVVGHSSGGLVATAVAEERPDLVAGLALIDTGPSLDAFISQGPISALVSTPGIGQLLWRVRTDGMLRKALDTAFTRTDVPERLLADVRGQTYHAFTSQADEFEVYLDEEPVPERLARLGLPTLVIFGDADERWEPAYSIDGYRRVSGVEVRVLDGIGHTPMVEDPATTASELTRFTLNHLMADG